MLRANPVAHEIPVTFSLEEFKIPFPNGAFFPGKSVNDVLHIWESTSLVSNAVTTRSASKKRKIIEIEDDVEDVNSPSGTETFHPNTQPIRERMRNHIHPFFQLLLLNPSNHSTALQINSGTFVSVMLQLLRFANFPTSNRPTIRLSVSSVFEQNTPANHSVRQKAKSLANSNESTQTSADRSQRQRT
jgi:hypothetical protein